MEPALEHEPLDGELPFEALADLVLRRDQYPLRSQAMRTLADRAKGESRLVCRLAEALRDGEPSVRRRAAQTLGCVGAAAQSALRELGQAMQSDPIWTVREAAVQAVSAISWPALEEYRSDEVPMQLVEIAIGDCEPLVREAAVNALAACMADKRVLGVCVKIEDRLANAMKHPHASRRCRAISAVCRLSQEEGWGGFAIHRGLRDSHWKVRRTTVQALGENSETAFWSPLQMILPELTRRVFDQHPVVQAAAREAVGRLLAASRNPTWVKLLASLSAKPSAVETLLNMLQDFAFSPHAERRFQEVCRRRANWHLQNLSEPIPWSLPGSGESAVRQLLLLAAKWQASPRRLAQGPEAARREVEEKEAAWLLARWLESYFGERVVLTDR